MTPTLTPTLAQWIVEQVWDTLPLISVVPHYAVILIALAIAMCIGVVLFLLSRVWWVSVLAYVLSVTVMWMFWHWVPGWIVAVNWILAVPILFFGFPTGSSNPTSDNTNIITGFSSGRYGERMKRAYASKFGGTNKGFNEEVDARIAVMRTQGKGDTRTIAQEWLKSRAHFVEIPWKDLKDEASKESET